jgi:SAM-dependent methyltransferase
MCRQCGLVFLDPMPTEAEVDEYYKHHYWLRSQGASEPTAKTILRGERRARERLRMLAPVLKPGARILDVGAGGAEFLVAARQLGFEVEGIEPSLGYARYCERTYGIKIHAATVAEIDFGTRKFDFITCNHALEHIRDPLDTLRRLHRILQPDGYLFVGVPDLAEPNRWPYRHYHIAHLHGFFHETLVMVAAKAGFAPIDSNQRGTSLVFRRLAEPDPNWFRFPDYPAKAETMLRERTVWRYFTSIDIYRRIPLRIASFLRDFFGVMWRSLQSRRT